MGSLGDPTILPLARLLLANALLRAAAAGSAQLLALMAGRRFDSTADGSGYLVLVGGLYFGAEIAVAPAAGRLADRFGAGPVLRFGAWAAVLPALLSWLFTTARDPPTWALALLLGARVFEGAALACTVPTSLTLLSRLSATTPARRSRVMGAFELTSLVGMFAGVGLAGLAWDAWGNVTFAWVAGGYCAAALLLSRGWASFEGSRAPRSSAARIARGLVRGPGRRGFMLAWLSVNAVVGLWLQHAPHLLTLRALTREQELVGAWHASGVSLLFGVYGLVILIGTTLWAFVGSSWPRRPQMTVALSAMIAVVPVIGGMNHGAPLLPMTAILILLVVLESGFTPAALAHLADTTDELDADRNTALAAYSILLSAGQLLGIVLGGLFAAFWQLDGLLGATLLLAVVALAGTRTISPSPGNLDRARA